jgi:hypothetical protein
MEMVKMKILGIRVAFLLIQLNSIGSSQFIGCFTYRTELNSNFFQIPSVAASATVDSCLQNCLNLYYR